MDETTLDFWIDFFLGEWQKNFKSLFGGIGPSRSDAQKLFLKFS